MEKYEQISVVGEGSYGIVMKCRHRDTDQMVAIKKFLETEEDATIRRMALREIRMLKRLKHENLITLIEVFRYKKRFYLVFEYLEGTVLDELEKVQGGLGEDRTREIIFQVIRAISYCHSSHIIHRDVKPENVLVSSLGVVKLCDFGFARIVSSSADVCTEYVATRWYRAPELLVGDPNYGPPVDVWAIGCLFAEMLTGDPLFPGESDIDQFYLIVKLLGKPCLKHQQLMAKNSSLKAAIKSPVSDCNLYKHFPNLSLQTVDFLSNCIKMDPQVRITSEEMLRHNYFLHDRFPQKFLPVLREKVNVEFNNPLLRRFKTEILMSTDKRDDRLKKGQIEQTRWRLEGSVKRKLSSDSTEAEGKNLISLTKSSQRLSVVKPKVREKVGSTVEMQMLEKSLESLAKFSQVEAERPISADKENGGQGSPFQSLFSFNSEEKSPHQVLHPSINNISFKGEKKSPKILQSLNVSKGNQTGSKGSFLKKLDRNVVVETGFGGPYHLEPLWFNSIASNLHQKKRDSKREEFSLPNLPGIMVSPTKSKKKSLPELDLTSNEPTPVLRFRGAKRKRNFLDITLPWLVKDDG